MSRGGTALPEGQIATLVLAWQYAASAKAVGRGIGLATDLLGRFNVLAPAGLSRLVAKDVKTPYVMWNVVDPALKDGATCRFAGMISRPTTRPDSSHRVHCPR